MNGKYYFTTFATVFQSCQDDSRILMKSCNDTPCSRRLLLIYLPTMSTEADIYLNTKVAVNRDVDSSISKVDSDQQYNYYLFLVFLILERSMVLVDRRGKQIGITPW